MRVHAGLTAAVIALVGCESVPSLTFEDASPAGDAAGAEAGDGALGCPSSLPPGATLCCGAHACYGTLCDPTTSCARCAVAACTPPDICCARANNAICLSSPMQCH